MLVHLHTSKKSLQIVVDFFLRRQIHNTVLAQIKFAPSAFGSSSVPQIPFPCQPQCLVGTPALGSAHCHRRFPKHQDTRSTVQRLLAKGSSPLKATSPHFPDFSIALGDLKKRNQVRNPILKALLAKRGKPEPPTSPNLPARRLLNRPLQTRPTSASFLMK